MSGVGASSFSRIGGDVIAGEHLGGGFGCLLRKEAAVVADDDAAPFLAWRVISLLSAWLRRRTLCRVKPSPMMRAPAAGAKGDQVLLFLAARTVKTLLQNELGLFQILRGVDALHLILIVELIALDSEPGADELMHAIGELVIAVHWRRRQLL